MKLKRACALILGLFLIFAIQISASAYDQPSVNLGFTSFMDGAPPSGPGFYFTEYVQRWTSDEFKDNNGDPLLPPAAGEDLEAWIFLSQLTYQSNTEIILGGKWGIDVLVPYVKIDLEYDMAGPFPQDNGTGTGDIWIGPYLQWDPVMGENGPKFMHRFSLGFVLPTGSYDRSKQLNQGSNVFSFNPYWAATYFFSPKWTATMRIYYLLNDENDEPSTPGLTTSKAGQAVHINFASAYEVIPGKLRLGINGYYLKQISDSEENGAKVTGKEQVFGIGPGMLFSFNKDAHFFINIYKETSAEMRPEGERINARFVYHF
ncbi:MAG: transporter [Desulfobacteraceae bacterium]|jgi:anthranilate 1,2-dioxygenase (deaminating, decarboxylating) large subunit